MVKTGGVNQRGRQYGMGCNYMYGMGCNYMVEEPIGTSGNCGRLREVGKLERLLISEG